MKAFLEVEKAVEIGLKNVTIWERDALNVIQPPQISMNAPHWSIVNIIDKAKALLNSLFFFFGIIF